MLAISSVSLSVGCDEGVPNDPDADTKAAGQGSMDDENMTSEEQKKLEDAIKPPPEVPAPKNK